MMNRRTIEESIVKTLMIISTFIISITLFLIIAAVLYKGLPSLNLDMITKTPKGGFYLGKEGGILNAILGSLYLASGSVFLSLLLSIPIALYMNLYLKKYSICLTSLRFIFEVLSGVPTIVYGAFGLTIMHFFKMRTSLLSGIITVSLLILPVMCRAIDEMIQTVSSDLIETSYSLGATKFETGLKVIVRQTLPGIITSIIIAFGRAIGDAASVLFTAGFSDHIPTSLFRPAGTLPLAIFFQLTSPIKEVQNRAYASALILTLLILILSITARTIRNKCNKYQIK